MGVVKGSEMEVVMFGLVAQQSSNAQNAGQGFAQMMEGLAGAISDFASGPNGQWLGYVVLIVIAVWLARRIGLMKS